VLIWDWSKDLHPNNSRFVKAKHRTLFPRACPCGGPSARALRLQVGLYCDDWLGPVGPYLPQALGADDIAILALP
jgi:hypothetical protein